MLRYLWLGYEYAYKQLSPKMTSNGAWAGTQHFLWVTVFFRAKSFSVKISNQLDLIGPPWILVIINRLIFSCCIFLYWLMSGLSRWYQSHILWMINFLLRYWAIYTYSQKSETIQAQNNQIIFQFDSCHHKSVKDGLNPFSHLLMYCDFSYWIDR